MAAGEVEVLLEVDGFDVEGGVENDSDVSLPTDPLPPN